MPGGGNRHSSDSRPRLILSPRGHLVMSRDVFDCHDWEWDATGIQRVEPRDAIEHATMNRIMPHNKLSSTKCQQVPLLRNLELGEDPEKEECQVRSRNKEVDVAVSPASTFLRLFSKLQLNHTLTLPIANINSNREL